MTRLTALTAAVLCVVSLMVAQAPPATACSRAAVSVKDALPESDGAFVGVFIGRDEFLPRGGLVNSARPVLNHFAVERSVKGDIGERVGVVAAASGASCGLEVEVGERIGLLLRHGSKSWESSLCSQTEPGALLTFVDDEPAFVAEEADGETETGDGRNTSSFIVIGLAVLVSPTFMAIRRAVRRRS